MANRAETKGPKGNVKGFKGKGPPWKGAKKGKARDNKYEECRQTIGEST